MSNSCEKCSECGADVPPRRRGTCSAPCKRKAKARHDRERYDANREASIARVQAWYEQNIARKKGYDSERRESVRTRRSIDPQFDALERQRLVAKSGADRARAKGAPAFVVTHRDLRRALVQAGYRCTYCEASFIHAPLEWDHVIPIGRGGHHSIGNLAPVCRSCNRHKSGRLLIEWRVKQLPKERS